MNRNLMPKSEQAVKILNERAASLAARYELIEEITEGYEYIRFTLGNEHYGISYRNATEVLFNLPITKIPHAPNFIAGTISHRGSLLSVINLKTVLNCKKTDYIDNYYIILVNYRKNFIGILVDNVEENDSYDDASLNTAFLSSGAIKREYVYGLHKNEVAIINIDNILADISKVQ